MSLLGSLVMARTPPPHADDPEQFKRFQAAAQELGVDESAGAIDRAFDKVVRPKEPPKRKPPSGWRGRG